MATSVAIESQKQSALGRLAGLIPGLVLLAVIGLAENLSYRPVGVHRLQPALAGA